VGGELLPVALAPDTADQIIVALTLGGEAFAHTVICQQCREAVGETSQSVEPHRARSGVAIWCELGCSPRS
jgi:hypothetical protein